MQCENCKIEHNGTYGSGRFCGGKCARGFSTKAKRSEINKKVSSKLSGRTLSDTHKHNIEKSNNFNRKTKITKHCLNCNDSMICRENDRRKFCSQYCWVNYTEKTKDEYLLYRQKCKFDFDVTKFQDRFNLSLIEQHGWYSPTNKGNNINGVSKDHMFSVKDGFDQKVNPDIIKHPANCQLMLHKQNQTKRAKSSITLNELLEKIKHW